MSLKRVSGAIIVGNLVFTSGRTGGTGDIESQIKNCLARLETILKDAGTSFENVVKATVYLSDLEYRPKYLNPIWNEVFGDNKPSRTCVEAGLGSADIEIDMIAVIPEKY
jgi:2-iminobutanoate/2-iminopropanoate deaminase